MTQSREERVREWTIMAWYFLHNGTMPEDEELEVHATEALKWGETNMAVTERFATTHARHSIILLARTHTPEALAATRVADLWNIQTPEDKVVINRLLTNNEDYRRLKQQAESWEKDPDYMGVGCAYYLFWPIGFFMHRSKKRSHEAFLKAEHIEYVIADAYFRSLDANEDYRRQLQILMNDYWASNDE